MEIIQKEKNGIVCITIKGRMGAELSLGLEKVIREIIRNDKRRILFDLGALEYLRSPTLRVILKTVKQINRRHGKVALCALNGYVQEIFEGNCFQGTFAIFDSVESGIRELLSSAKAAELRPNSSPSFAFLGF